MLGYCVSISNRYTETTRFEHLSKCLVLFPRFALSARLLLLREAGTGDWTLEEIQAKLNDDYEEFDELTNQIK